MELTKEQRKRLHGALVGAFPERQDIARMVQDSLGKNLSAISGDSNTNNVIFELLTWAGARGATLAVLIKGAVESNPDDPALHDIAEELGVIPSTTVVADPNPATPPLPQQLRLALTNALLKVSGISNMQTRTNLLAGLPGSDLLNRDPYSAFEDLNTIISQLEIRGWLKSGGWPVLHVIDNALPRLEGFVAQSDLAAIREKIAQLYAGG